VTEFPVEPGREMPTEPGAPRPEIVPDTPPQGDAPPVLK